MILQNTLNLRLDDHQNLIDSLHNNSEIHLYKINFDEFDIYAENIEKVVSEQEKNSASKFIFGKDKKFYLFRRFFVRNILSLYTSMEPKKIEFKYNKYGKPFLKENLFGIQKKIYFNLSHSNNLAICGISNSELGIDIEYLDYKADILNIKDTICSEKEIAAFFLKNEQKTSQIKKIYKLWSCKEAYIKLVGTGLSNDLKNIEISEDFSCVSNLKEDTSEIIINSIYEEEKNYTASVAYEGKKKHKYIPLLCAHGIRLADIL